MKKNTLDIILVTIIVVLAILIRWQDNMHVNIEHQYEKIIEAAGVELRECILNIGNPNLSPDKK